MLKKKKKKIKYGTAGGRCQTDQLVLHNFSIKLDCQHVCCFVFVFEKKEGMACPVVILFSNTVSRGAFPPLV